MGSPSRAVLARRRRAISEPSLPGALFWAFAGLLMLAPLPFGMVHEAVQALFACLVLALVCLTALPRALAPAGAPSGDPPAVSLRTIAPEAAAFCLVFLWAGFQLLPLSPEAWRHPLWAEAGEALGRDLPGAIHLAPGAGWAALLRLATYGAVFWLALQWGRDRDRARRLLGAVVLAAALYALYGLAVQFADVRSVLWVGKTRYVEDVTGVFVNRNSFATYLGLALLWGGAYYLHLVYRALESGREGRDRTVFLVQQLLVRAAPHLAALLILLTALLLTHSRAGTVAALASLVLLALLYGPVQRISRAGRLLSGGTLAVAAAAVLLLSGAAVLQRLAATDLEREQRLQVYERVAQAVEGAPWTGHGHGSFAQAYPLYADRGSAHWDKAHNDWLEAIFELGRPAAFLWFAVLAGLGLRCLIAVFRRRRDRLYPAAAFCACVLVGLHSAVDFSLQIPAVAVTFAALLGVGTAQSRSSGETAGP